MLMFGALVALAGLALLALSVGRYPLGAGDVWMLIFAKLSGGAHGLSPQAETVLFELRGPRILGAVVIGAALSGAGAVFQNLFRNPLVSPDILGVSSGAALGAVLAIFLSLPLFAIQGFAFAGGLLAVMLVYVIGNAVRGHDPILSLILTGVVVGSLLASLIALLRPKCTMRSCSRNISISLAKAICELRTAACARLRPTGIWYSSPKPHSWKLPL